MSCVFFISVRILHVCAICCLVGIINDDSNGTDNYPGCIQKVLYCMLAMFQYKPGLQYKLGVLGQLL